MKAQKAGIGIVLAFLSSIVLVHPAEALTLHTVVSPDGSTRMTVRNENDGTLTYNIQQNGKTVIQHGTLGVKTEAYDLSEHLYFDGETQRKVKQNYTLIEHFNGEIHSQSQEMTLRYHRDQAHLTLTIRASHDGVAFRYSAHGIGNTRVTSEKTTFFFPKDTGLWASPYREARDYEDTYPYVSAENLHGKHFSMPVLGSLRNNDSWFLISEASTYVNPTYPATRLDGADDTRTLRVALPGSDRAPLSNSREDTAVPVHDAFNTPWRVIVTSPSLNTLTQTSLFTDLNPAVSPTEDLSWIRTGKALWSWWSNEENALQGDDMRHSQKQYINSAAALNAQFVTMDCCYSDTDGSVEELAKYAMERGIGLFIWKHKGDFTRPDGTYFSQEEVDQLMSSLASRGIAGLKIDFMQSDRLETLTLYDRIARSALKHRLMVNFHGSTKPGGENRTYPNIVTSEAVLGSEQYKYGRPPTATHDATLPFTRNIVGGMDATPVIFSNSTLKTTVAHQLALSIVYSSAMLHLADSAAAYETWPGRHLLRALPTVWDESRLLAGFPDDYAVFARRNADEWFIGGITDEARSLSIPLSFLNQNTTYTATIFSDINDGRALTISTQRVTSRDSLDLRMLRHGGISIHISRAPLPCEDHTGTLFEAELSHTSGQASISPCPGCSGSRKVGNLGSNGAITFPNISVDRAGIYTLSVGYLSEDPRSFLLRVNDRNIVVAPPRSGKGNDGQPSGWEIVRTVDIPVELHSGTNTVTISGNTPWAPDIDRVIVR